MKVAVIGGTGYVGLVTGIGLSVHHNDVICADIDQKKVNEMQQGMLPIHEADLDVLLKEAKDTHKIRFTSCIQEAVAESDIIMITVGTPENKNGDTDLTYLLRAVKAVAHAINGHKTIVIKSTVPVGTCEMVKQCIKDNLRDPFQTFEMASNPEFLREGSAVKDFMFPERIVIGADNDQAVQVLKQLYSTFDAPLIITDTRSAELIKYACNSYLATRISFINEIAEICEKTGADIHSVIEGMKLDQRIGSAYLSPGPGFGGPCLSKDIKSLIHFATRSNANVSLLQSVLNRNELQIKTIFHKILVELGASMNKKISILGLSFKAGTNDIRNSPAVHLIEMLSETRNKIVAYDPVVKSIETRAYANFSMASSLEHALEDSDCMIVMTEWEEFRAMDLEVIYEKMRVPIIMDTRNIIDIERAREIGFRFIGKTHTTSEGNIASNY